MKIIQKYWYDFSISLKSPKSFVGLLLMMIVLYSLCYFNILPEILFISVEESKIILDHNISISIVFFAVSASLLVLILSIVQINRKHEDMILLILQESLLLPTLWFLIIHIFFLVVINFLFTTNTLFSNLFFIRAIGMSFLLLLVEIIFIGLLFFRIYQIVVSDLIFDKFLKRILYQVNKEMDGKKYFEISNNTKRILEKKLFLAMIENDTELILKIIETYYKIFKINPSSTLVDGFNNFLISSAENAIDQKSKMCLQNTINILFKLINEDILNKDWAKINSLIYIPSHIYQLCWLNNFYKIDFVSLVSLNLNYSINQLNKYDIDNYCFEDLKEKYPSIIFSLLLIFNSLIKSIIDFKDIESLKMVENHFYNLTHPFSREINQIDKKISGLSDNVILNDDLVLLSLKKDTFTKFSDLKRQLRFGFYAWSLYHLSLLENYKHENTKKNISIVKCLFPKNILPIDLLNDIFDYIKHDFSDLNWRNWTDSLEERLPGKVYYVPSTSDWVIRAFAILALKINFRIDINTQDPNYYNLVLYELLKEQRNHMVGNYNKYNNFIGLASQEFYNSEFDRLLNIFKISTIEYYKRTYKEITDEPLSKDKIIYFKKYIIDQIRDMFTVFKIFKFFENIHSVSENTNIKKWEEKRLYHKSFFIEKYNAGVPQAINIGNVIGLNIQNFFFNKIKKDYCKVEKDIITSIDKILNDFENNNFNSIIIVSSDLVLSFINSISKSSSFRRPESNDDYNGLSIEGFYNNIPIISPFDQYSKNTIIIADFVESFDLNIYEKEHSLENISKIIIRNLTDEEIEKNYNSNPEYWTTIMEEKIDKSDSITLIKNNIIIQVELYLSFTIKNPNAYEIINIKDKYSFS